MDTLKFILDKWDIDPDQPKMPIEIPNVGRNDLAKLFGELGFVVGAEIGVLTGLYSEVLCTNNHGLKLYCIDPWAGYPTYMNVPLRNQTWDGAFYEARKRLVDFDVEFIRKTSMRALHHFENGSLDFVYIDANHCLPYVMDDIIWWTEKVRPGGIVAGHDYIKFKSKKNSCDVIEATNWYTYLKGIRPWFLLGTKAKIKGQTRDISRSWFWVKS
jgi:hypothetical protein